jgi:NAD(P)-dependent dehydrogenase (short-subunit alcohol dehydrogenase family)
MLLEDRVVIVSGIGPGLGRDAALALARQGAHLALGARSAERLEAVAEEVRGLGRQVLAFPTDITRAEDCARLARQTRERFGRVAVLVNNAFHPGSFAPLEQDDLRGWRDPFEVNVLGSLRLSQSVIPAMKEQGGGSIVMINSMVIRNVLPTMASYAASKGALMAATLTLARELGPYGIRVNAVVPGYIWAAALEGWFRHQAKQRGVDPQVVYDEVAREIALGRIPTAEEIADAIVFFASDLSRVVTGQALDVNGGHVFHGF